MPVPCKAKMQYLLTLQVNKYSLLALQSLRLTMWLRGTRLVSTTEHHGAPWCTSLHLHLHPTTSQQTRPIKPYPCGDALSWRGENTGVTGGQRGELSGSHVFACLGMSTFVLPVSLQKTEQRTGWDTQELECHTTTWTTHSSQQTRTRLVQCWPSVSDAGPTLNQPWVNVSRLPG